jgi:hypothetical protein
VRRSSRARVGTGTTVRVAARSMIITARRGLDTNRRWRAGCPQGAGLASLRWEIFVQTCVDGCDNLLKDVLFLFDERGFLTVLSFV